MKTVLIVAAADYLDGVVELQAEYEEVQALCANGIRDLMGGRQIEEIGDADFKGLVHAVEATVAQEAKFVDLLDEAGFDEISHDVVLAIREMDEDSEDVAELMEWVAKESGHGDVWASLED